jgi:CheY-like chemotaxis protein
VRRNSGAISDQLADGDYLQLEVTDTGRGISLEMQAKVFDPFFTTKSAGHGLGLAVVQGIVRGLGGSIHLMSALGKGTTFQILLPVAETADPATTDAVSGREEPARPSQPRTVLLVEDESPLRLAVGKMLRHRGYKVFEAGDGLSAITLFREEADKIDLILLDLTIPGASSSEVVAEAAQVRPDIRVILTSAYSQEMIKDTMSAPQIRNFIRKPFQLEDLVKMLENVLSES